MIVCTHNLMHRRTTDEAVTRGTKALSIVFSFTNRVPTFIQQSHLEASEGATRLCRVAPDPHQNPADNEAAWSAYWSPILQTFTTQATNPCRAIRHTAFAFLQRCLLSPSLTSSLASTDSPNRTDPSASMPNGEDGTPTAIATKISETVFGMVLFPLITRLLKPEVYQSDPLGMTETRVQAATLLCKVFLSRMEDIKGLGGQWGLVGIWEGILSVCDRLMGSGVGGNELVRFLHFSLQTTRNPARTCHVLSWYWSNGAIS